MSNFWGELYNKGYFSIRNVQPGKYILSVSYIGYQSQKKNIEVFKGKTLKLDFFLYRETLKGETVIVTAQAKGQMAAINEQLSSSEIKNVVSKARIRELPDANAAESVGRLPGISILREGGEGNKVVIRGLSPKYNKVMIDGVAMSSTDGGDRSVDMSMISSYSLEGIEAIKAPTANMDGDQIGGAVNFIIKTAEKGLKYNIVLQGGYNNLKKTYNDYMIVGGISNRFLDDKLGLFAQVNIEQKNLSSNQMGAGYYLIEKNIDTTNSVYNENLSLTNSVRERKRYGGTLTFDYKIPNGLIYFKNFLSSGDTHNNEYYEGFDIKERGHNYSTSGIKNDLLVYNNILSYKQQFSAIKIKAKLAHSYSENKTPNNISFSFYSPADLTEIPYRLPPEQIPDFAKNNIDNAFLASISDNTEVIKGRKIMASLDLATDINISNQINGQIKFGGKYKYNDRYYDFEGSGGVMFLGSGQATKDAILSAFPWMQKTTPLGSTILPYSLFIDKNFKHGEFLKGQYNLGPVANINLMNKVVNVVRNLEQPSPETYSYLQMSSTTSDYSGNEYLTAAYLMADFNLTNKIKFIPGIRYEHNKTEYTGVQGISATAFPEQKYVHNDTTTERSIENWLPMIHLQYKPFDWLQIRLAYTKTLSRPDFNLIIPRKDIGQKEIIFNNYKLKPERSENLDLYFAFSNNYVGLFTAGVFQKNISDMIFWTDRRILIKPSDFNLDASQKGKFIITQENNTELTIVKGIELDWQTNFWYLPSFLKGFVLNINYTNVFSEAKYPRTIIKSEYLLEPPYGVKLTNQDTTYSDRLLNQPVHILNVALGYDFKDFSCRLSMLFQSNIFSGPNFWPELRTYTDDYLRWDFSMKQKLPWEGLQVYLNLVNISAAIDKVINAGSNFPTSEEHYGRTIQFGLRWEPFDN